VRTATINGRTLMFWPQVVKHSDARCDRRHRRSPVRREHLEHFVLFDSCQQRERLRRRIRWIDAYSADRQAPG